MVGDFFCKIRDTAEKNNYKLCNTVKIYTLL